MDLGIAYMKKLILTPVTKNFEVWANLWMLASLASQIPILSFGVASAWIGIFLIRSRCSLIRKILPIPSQFFVTGVKIRYLRGYCIISAYLISKDTTYIWSTYSIPLPLQIHLIKISMRTVISGGKDLYKNLTNLLFSIMNLLVSFWCYSVGNEIGQRLSSILRWVSRVEIKRNIIYHSDPFLILISEYI